MADKEHYLKQELYALIRRDPRIFDFLQEASLDGLWYWDLENPENEWMSPGFWTLLGFNPREKKHLPSEWQHLIDPDDLQTALHNLERHCRNPDHPYDQVVRYRHKNGSTVWVRCRGLAIRGTQGNPVRLLGAHIDLTAIKAVAETLRLRTIELEQAHREQLEARKKIAEQAKRLEKVNRELKELAARDPLTGLYNVRSFEDQVRALIGLAARGQFVLSLMILDIDHFKRINDRFGHTQGDVMLKAVAAVLQTTARDSDLVARYGGDEFLIALPNTDESESLVVAERFRDAVEKHPWKTPKITVSIGVATLKPAASAEIASIYARLSRRADQALYMAKETQRNQVCHHAETSCMVEQGATRNM